MRAARIAATAIALLVPHVFGQPEPQIALSLTVTDQIGARLAGARIQVRCGAPSKTLTEKTADEAGKAVVTVHPGDCTVFVGAPGFRSWLFKVDANEKSRSITAVLPVGEPASGFPLNTEETIQIQFQTIEALIPFEELALLTKLPQHKLRQRHSTL